MTDLPPNYDRHQTALEIVELGASNPCPLALELHKACRQAIAEGFSQRKDPAVRLIALQLAHLLNVDRILDCQDYTGLVDTCRAGADAHTEAAR